jgi:hypothetical protein
MNLSPIRRQNSDQLGDRIRQSLKVQPGSANFNGKGTMPFNGSRREEANFNK